MCCCSMERVLVLPYYMKMHRIPSKIKLSNLFASDVLSIDSLGISSLSTRMRKGIRPASLFVRSMNVVLHFSPSLW